LKFIQKDIQKLKNNLKYAFILSVILFLITGGCSREKVISLNEKINRIDIAISKTIADFDINSSNLFEEIYQIKEKNDTTFTFIEKTYRIKNKAVDFKDVLKKLDKNLAELNASITRSKFSYLENHNLANFDIKTRGLKVYTLNLESVSKKKSGPKIAIVIDDWGYNLNNLGRVWDLDIPMTFSILPNLPYSTVIAKEAIKKNYEVILHLPMESHNAAANEKHVVKTGMNGRQIAEILKRALRTVPQAKGVSNHMGSKATEDKDTLKLLFRQMKKNDLYFLDSLVTNRTESEEAAKEVSLKIAKRSVFIDNRADFDYIKKQMQELVTIAKAKGEAIGVGHDKKSTLLALKEIIPELKKENIDFVYLSEIVNPAPARRSGIK